MIVLGQLIMTAIKKEIRFDDLLSGVYFVHVMIKDIRTISPVVNSSSFFPIPGFAKEIRETTKENQSTL